MRITLHSIEPYSETDSYYLRNRLPAGHRYYVVEMTIENVGQPTFTHNRLDLTLQTSPGYLYEYEISSATANQPTLPSIPLGVKIRVVVSFAIPIDESPVKLFYDHPDYYEDPMIFDLQPDSSQDSLIFRIHP